MKCLSALSLRETPIPSRTTRKSYRPRASDRPMCCQPGNRSGLSASETDRRRRYSIRMQPRWNYARPTPSPHAQGLEGKEISSPSSRGRKIVLDFSSYRPGVNGKNLCGSSVCALHRCIQNKLKPVSACGGKVCLFLSKITP